MRGNRIVLALGISGILLCGSGGYAFDKNGCGGGECRECHTLSREEAGKILGGMVDNVLNVEMSPVQGLWVVDIEKGGRKIPVYIDFSKKYLIGGQIIRIETKEDVTGNRMMKLNEIRTDVSKIPLEDTILIGKSSATQKVVVFSDPDCHFCAKLHEEMKTVVAKDPDVAFHVKLYSRSNSPAVNEMAKAVLCSKSSKLLEDAYAKKPLPPAICKTDAPGETFRLTEKLGIRGTPALVLPDGRVVGGYRTADALRKLLAEAKAAVAADANAREKGNGKK
jgi:thiol:disulfide interchange protein DsbC